MSLVYKGRRNFSLIRWAFINIRLYIKFWFPFLKGCVHVYVAAYYCRPWGAHNHPWHYAKEKNDGVAVLSSGTPLTLLISVALRSFPSWESWVYPFMFPLVSVLLWCLSSWALPCIALDAAWSLFYNHNCSWDHAQTHTFELSFKTEGCDQLGFPGTFLWLFGHRVTGVE